MNKFLLSEWRKMKTKDDILRKELKFNDNKLEKFFNKNMEFGTAGIRGIMGAGTEKMNEFTVAAAAQAYAEFLLEYSKKTKEMKIIIGHDNRNNSILFSETAARVLEQNGIQALLFKNNEMQPTPLVSYAIRKLKLLGGIIITASHNPKEYNGFKVYNSLGAQLLPNDTKKIQEIMSHINPLKVSQSSNKLRYLDNFIIQNYINETIEGASINFKKNLDLNNIKVAFSPLQGTSEKIIPFILSRLNIKNFIVRKQAKGDPNFSKTKSSNPENIKAYNKVIALAKRKKTDLAIVTDPDADRIGVVTKHKRKYKYLNGNQLAALYLEYKLYQLKIVDKLPKDGYIVKTNVSGNLPKKIAEKYGIKVYEVHVGFKNIADLIENTKGTFILGYEESYGMVLNASLVRDKDSIQSAIGIVEMTSYYKSQNINLFEQLQNLYKYYGIHESFQISRKVNFRETNLLLEKIIKLRKISDFKISIIQDYRKKINKLSKANLVKVIFENNSWFAIRPSGTEPKLKIYIQCISNSEQKEHEIVSFKKAIVDYINKNI